MESDQGLERDLALPTGTEAAGRLARTPGAVLVGEHLAGELEVASFEPGLGDGWFQDLPVPIAYIAARPKLRFEGVTFDYRADFAELPHISTAGRLTAPLAVVREGEDRDPAELAGSVVLVPGRVEGFRPRATAAMARDAGVNALIVEGGENTRLFQSNLFAGEGILPVLKLRASFVVRLAAADGGRVALFHVPENAREVIRLLGFSRGLNVVRSLEEAVKALRNRAVPDAHLGKTSADGEAALHEEEDEPIDDI